MRVMPRSHPTVEYVIFLVILFSSISAHIQPTSHHDRFQLQQEQFLESEGEIDPKRSPIVTHGSFRLRTRKRFKRNTDHPEDHDVELELTADDPIWGQNVKTHVLKLKKSTQLLAPQYELVVRDGRNVSVNRTVAYPTCLYTSSDSEEFPAALSTCHGNILKGILIANGTKLVVAEEVAQRPRNGPKDQSSESLSRPKRDGEDFDTRPDSEVGGEGTVLIYEAETTGGECGIKPENLKRMHAPSREAIAIKLGVGEFPNESIEASPWDGDHVEFPSQSYVRKKRSTGGRKTIELAVFVDDALYRKEAELHPNDPVYHIQDLVFTYLNSVQLLYNSNKLDTRLRVVLVRLEIFKSPITGINNSGGDIERYLDSFCAWQKLENPGSDDMRDDTDNPGHWDHGLLLTGLNLFDRQPKFDSVIGLAWVSGMCHPSYSCTINEGSNFESVYVIAHEMGHNLGMNHDGESREGNTCNPDKFLMSPILGPGKVTWSTCSNEEISEFISGRVTKTQALCLEDMPEAMARYDFLKDSKAPGDKFKAIEQCQKAFNQDFKPHVKPDPPFEDLCRELWCSNETHALRAHPALEGTDCRSKPFPYGSICVSGICSPFDPNDDGVTELDGNDVTRNGDGNAEDPAGNRVDIIKDRPAWYDPIFTEIFMTLRAKFSERYPRDNGQVRILPLSTRNVIELDSANIPFPISSDPNNVGGPSWISRKKLHEETYSWAVDELECPVPCGGGWANVSIRCKDALGAVTNEDHCEALGPKPVLAKKTCNLNPCA